VSYWASSTRSLKTRATDCTEFDSRQRTELSILPVTFRVIDIVTIVAWIKAAGAWSSLLASD